MKLLVLPVLLFFTNACMSFVSGQTGRNMKRGQSGGYVALTMKNEETKQEEGSTDKIHWTGQAVAVRHGLTNEIEIGGKAASGGFGMILGRYSLVDGRQFAAAAGLGLGFINYRYAEDEKEGSEDGVISLSADGKSHFRVTDVPLFLSYDFTKAVTAYTTPRYRYIHISGDDSDSSSRYVSLSVGLVYGGKVGFFGEATHFQDLDDNTDYKGHQLAGGIVFR